MTSVTELNTGSIIIIVLSSSVIAALLTTYGNYLINRKKLHAEIISKSRIEWIQEVRRVTSEFVNEYYYAIRLSDFLYLCNWLNEINYQEYNEFDENNTDLKRYDELQKQIKKTEVQKTEYSNKLNDQLVVVKAKQIELSLYFPKGKNKNIIDKNTIIKEKLDKVYNLLQESKTTVSGKTFDEMKNEVNKVMEDISDYLKNEWDRAKAKE